MLTSLTIGGAGIIHSVNTVASDSAQIMDLLCANKAQQIELMLSQIQQSVKTLALYAVKQIDDFEKFQTQSDYVEAYSKNLLEIAINSAQNTQGAMTAYIRFNPEFTDPQSGLFCSYVKEENIFRSITPTDLSLYAPSDTSHVGWFYEPAKNKTGTWMAPYLNENINVKMISYVVPFYYNTTFVGVVGMDIDFSVLEQIVSNTTVYNTGYAFLADQKGAIIHHKILSPETNLHTYNNGEFANLAIELKKESNHQALFPYQYQGEKREAAFESLSNGMRFVLCAPTKEINVQARHLVIQIGIAIISVILVASAIALIFSRRLVKPLLELNIAAKKIADGDLSVSITHQSKDEVGMLAESFRQTVNNLHKYISYINELAYRDSLTGVKNKTAYQEAVTHLEEKIRYKRPQFAIIVFDLNGLKAVNDTRGHDFGDIFITDTCNIICKTFKRTPIYRIGGDEFVAILEDTDYQNYSSLLDLMETEIQHYNQQPNHELHISVARGIALFSEGVDLSYHDVFKRADNSMYHNKAEMKARNSHQ